MAGVACGALLGHSSPAAVQQGLMLVGAALGWQAVGGAALLLPLIGMLRSLLASLIPPDPPVGSPATSGSAGAIHPLTESFQSEWASLAEISALATDPESSPALPPGAEPAVSPAANGIPGPFVARLAIPVIRHFQHKNLPAGDLVVATAVILLAWRWLWQGSLALLG